MNDPDHKPKKAVPKKKRTARVGGRRAKSKSMTSTTPSSTSTSTTLTLSLPISAECMELILDYCWDLQWRDPRCFALIGNPLPQPLPSSSSSSALSSSQSSSSSSTSPSSSSSSTLTAKTKDPNGSYVRLGPHYDNNQFHAVGRGRAVHAAIDDSILGTGMAHIAHDLAPLARPKRAAAKRGRGFIPNPNIRSFDI